MEIIKLLELEAIERINIALNFFKDPSEYLPKINAITSEGYTFLHVACKHSSISNEMVDVLLKHGADPNASDRTGLTPLHVASRVSATFPLFSKLLPSVHGRTSADP